MTGLSDWQAFERGVGAVALVLGEGDVLASVTSPVSLSTTVMVAVDGHDLGVELPGGLRGGGALLRLERIGVHARRG